jgi:hypothetical protein
MSEPEQSEALVKLGEVRTSFGERLRRIVEEMDTVAAELSDLLPEHEHNEPLRRIAEELSDLLPEHEHNNQEEPKTIMSATAVTYDVAHESAAQALYGRVLRAYERRFGDFADTPSLRDSTLDAAGRIVLRSHERVLARYRVRGDRLFFIVPSGLGSHFRRPSGGRR